jgi:hypothetical protein
MTQDRQSDDSRADNTGLQRKQRTTGKTRLFAGIYSKPCFSSRTPTASQITIPSWGDGG